MWFILNCRTGTSPERELDMINEDVEDKQKQLKRKYGESLPQWTFHSISLSLTLSWNWIIPRINSIEIFRRILHSLVNERTRLGQWYLTRDPQKNYLSLFLFYFYPPLYSVSITDRWSLHPSGPSSFSVPFGSMVPLILALSSTPTFSLPDIRPANFYWNTNNNGAHEKTTLRLIWSKYFEATIFCVCLRKLQPIDRMRLFERIHILALRIV